MPGATSSILAPGNASPFCFLPVSFTQPSPAHSTGTFPSNGPRQSGPCVVVPVWPVGAMTCRLSMLPSSFLLLVASLLLLVRHLLLEAMHLLLEAMYLDCFTLPIFSFWVGDREDTCSLHPAISATQVSAVSHSCSVRRNSWCFSDPPEGALKVHQESGGRNSTSNGPDDW